MLDGDWSSDVCSSDLASDEVAAVYLGTSHGGKKSEAGLVGARAPAKPPGAISALVSGAAAGTRSSRSPVLELKSIHAGYGQARVLNGIDLTVDGGKVVAILGTNGAGKTTLSNVISGSIKPTAGRMLVDGVDVTGAPAHRIARLGLSQCMEGRRIFAPLSVEENLLLPARAVPAVQRAERLERVYALFPDLKDRRHNAGTSMSGGQQQMLAIGRALMSRPRLVLFDEISLGLAPIMMDRLYLALAELRAAGLTMLIVEQDVERALDLADEVHVMEHGRFALSGSASAIREDPRLRHLYIGTAD
jgi:ABC-type branched-subunit amino acid transport system ATPase component